MLRKVFVLAIALLLAILATFLQQFFSTDRPYKFYMQLNEIEYKIKLPAIHDEAEECLFEINIPDTAVKGTIYYRQFNSSEKWAEIQLIRMGDNLVSVLPANKPNSKLEFYVTFTTNGNIYNIGQKEPLVVRYLGEVPKLLTYSYVILLFISLLLAIYVGLISLYNIDSYKKYSNYLFYMFGAITLLGIIIHYMWYRHFFIENTLLNDLKLYKYILAFGLWAMVYKLNKKYKARFITLIVSVITLILYIVPTQSIFKLFQ